MTSNDREVLKVLAPLEVVFGAQPPEKMRVYLQGFGTVGLEELKVAVAKCLQECTRFPVPADILARLPGRLSPADQAEAAWQRALHSAYYGPDHYNPNSGTTPTGADLDPVTFSAIGGVAGLRRIWDSDGDPSRLGFIRREFLESYQAIARMNGAGLLPTGDPIARIEGRKEPRRIGEVVKG